MANRDLRTANKLFLLCFFFILYLLFFIPDSANAAVIVQAPKYVGLNSGLVGYWGFDGADVVGSTVYDKSGNGNNGTLTNGPTRVEGKIGQGLEFSGNNYVRVEDHASLDLTTTGTLVAWAIPKTPFPASPNCAQVLHKDDDSFAADNYGRIYNIQHCGNNQIFNGIYSNGSTVGAASSNTTAQKNTWIHLAATYDGSNIRLYVNGVLEGTAAYSSTVKNSPGPLFIGAGRLTNAGDDEYFRGVIDDVRVYNRSLSPDEIKRLYKIGSTFKIGETISNDSLKKGLVGHWTFDGPDVVGATAYDKSGMYNTGKMWQDNDSQSVKKTEGKIGQAALFDGIGDAIDSGSLASNGQLVSPFSYSAWIYLNAHAGEGACATIMAKFRENNSSSDDLHSWLGLNSTNGTNLSLSVYDDSAGSGVSITRNYTGKLETGRWYYVSATYNGGTTPDAISVYLDGVKIDNQSSSNGTFLNVDDISNALFSLGAYWDFDSASYLCELNGKIDDARVYNRVLSPDEIKRLYKIGGTFKINQTLQGDILKNGLVGHWTFDGPDVVNVTAYDKSGQGNNGRLENGPTRVEGKISQALQFDGVDSDVVISTGVAIDSGTTHTFSFWVKRSSNAEGQNYIFDSGSQRLVIDFGLNCGSSNTFCVHDSAAWRSLGFTASTNEWHHLALVLDASTSLASGYLDGVFSGSAAYAPTTINGATRIGNYFGGGVQGTAYKGALDDFRIYNRTLSANEIKSLYNMGR